MNKRIQSGDVKPLIRDYSLSNVVLKNRDLLHILSVVMFECFNKNDSSLFYQMHAFLSDVALSYLNDGTFSSF